MSFTRALGEKALEFGERVDGVSHGQRSWLSPTHTKASDSERLGRRLLTLTARCYGVPGTQKPPGARKTWRLHRAIRWRRGYPTIGRPGIVRRDTGCGRENPSDDEGQRALG